MRHRENQKSLAFVYKYGGHPCINPERRPMSADFLRSAFSGVVLAYHMNKAYWNTVLLGSEVLWSELQQMVRQSYKLTKPR